MLAVLLWVRWIPAHRAAPGAAITEARSQAATLRVDWPLRERRAAALWALRVMHDVSSVKVATSAVARGGLRRAARRRYPRMGQFVRLLHRGTITAGRGGLHPVVHALEPRSGPWREGGEPGWVFSCGRCGATAVGRRTVRALLVAPLGGRDAVPGARLWAPRAEAVPGDVGADPRRARCGAATGVPCLTGPAPQPLAVGAGARRRPPARGLCGPCASGGSIWFCSPVAPVRLFAPGAGSPRPHPTRWSANRASRQAGRLPQRLLSALRDGHHEAVDAAPGGACVAAALT